MGSGFRGALVCVAVGLILLLSSLFWPRVLKDEWVWDEVQAQEHAMAAADLHQLTHEAAEVQVDNRLSQTEKQRAADELDAAQRRYQASREKLDRARASRQTTAVVLRWLGVALLIVGIVRYMAVRDKTRRR